VQCHGSDYLLYLSRSWKAEWLSGHYGIRPPHSAQCSVLLHYYPTSLLHTSRRITTNVHFHESLSKLNWLITRTKTKVSWDPYLLELEEPPLWTPKSTFCAQTSQNKPKTKKKNQNPFTWIKNPSLPFQFSTFYLLNQWDYKKRPNTSIIYVQVIVLLFSLEVLSSQAWTQNWVWLTRSNIHTSNTTYIVHTKKEPSIALGLYIPMYYIHTTY